MAFSKRKIFGFGGEDKAADFLQKIGYKILERNYLLPAGEIDILAQDKNVLVIVEVKSVSGSSFGPAKGYVNAKKQHKLRQLAGFLMQEYPNRMIRIDVVGIEIIDDVSKIEHIKNAVEGL